MTKSDTNNSPSAPEQNKEASQPTRRYTLKKSERLYGKKTFDILFEQGESFYEGPLRFVYTNSLPEYYNRSPLMAGISVPKRRFKRASDRNFLKRKLREAARLNKHDLRDVLIEKNQNLAVLITYNSKKIHNFHTLNKAVVAGFKRLEEMV